MISSALRERGKSDSSIHVCTSSKVENPSIADLSDAEKEEGFTALAKKQLQGQSDFLKEAGLTK
jgi:hypothetical protein